VPRLTIIIPSPHAPEHFEDTLASVLQNRPQDCEVIVAHGHSYADPYGLRGEVRFLQVSGNPQITDLLNSGLEAARGTIVHTLACGTSVEEGWADAALEHFEDEEVASVTPLLVDTRDPSQVITAGVGHSSLGTRQLLGKGKLSRECRGLASRVQGPVLAAGFYRRSVLIALGGFATNLGDELADLDFALSAKALGMCTNLETGSRVLANDEATQSILLCNPRSFAAGRQAERLFWRHQSQFGSVASVLHPMAVAGETVLNLTSLAGIGRFLGRCVAALEFGTTRQHQSTLQGAGDYLAESSELAPATVSLQSRSRRPVESRKAA